MTARRRAHRVAVVLIAIVWLACPVPSASAQDALARAKDLYLSASYDEALTVLDGLQSNPPRDAATEVAQYRVLCLLALNRSDDARQAIEKMVNLDPFYKPSDSMSPRIRTVIEDTRKQMLPAVVQQSYAEAKAAFDRKDPQATKLFERVLLLLDDPDMPKTPSTTDLRTVASGFRDLSKAVAATAAAPAPPTPPPAATAAPQAAPQETAAPPTSPRETPASSSTRTNRPPVIGSPAAASQREPEEKVVPPVAISQALPRWAPANSVEAARIYKGQIEITIDEQGNVTNAMIRQSLTPTYDAALLEGARAWKYKPATRNGVPVPFQKTIDVELKSAGK